MPAPKRANTTAATEAAALAARQRRLDGLACELRGAGWIVAEPGTEGAANALVDAYVVLTEHVDGSDLAALEDARAAVEQFRQ
jgi:hypothetical protein